MNLYRQFGGLVAIAALTLGLGAQQARAQNFTFTSIYASPTITSGTSTLTFTNGASAGTDGTPTAVVLGNITEFTTPGTGPNVFTNAPYTINFTLTDAASATSQTGAFHGLISGQADGGVGGNAPSAFFTNTDTSPLVLTFTFAGGTYTVSRTSFVSPGPNGSARGSMGAIVTFSGATPEPGAFMSLGLGGLVLFGMLASRRRKLTATA